MSLFLAMKYLGMKFHYVLNLLSNASVKKCVTHTQACTLTEQLTVGIMLTTVESM